MSEDSLTSVSIDKAEAVFILCNNLTSDPQREDAENIMRVHSVSYNLYLSLLRICVCLAPSAVEHSLSLSKSPYMSFSLFVLCVARTRSLAVPLSALCRSSSLCIACCSLCALSPSSLLLLFPSLTQPIVLPTSDLPLTPQSPRSPRNSHPLKSPLLVKTKQRLCLLPSATAAR